MADEAPDSGNRESLQQGEAQPQPEPREGTPEWEALKRVRESRERYFAGPDQKTLLEELVRDKSGNKRSDLERQMPEPRLGSYKDGETQNYLPSQQRMLDVHAQLAERAKYMETEFIDPHSMFLMATERNRMDRVRMYGEVADPKVSQQERERKIAELLPMTVESDLRAKIIVYEEALIEDFWKTEEEYALYMARYPDLRKRIGEKFPERLKKMEEREKRVKEIHEKIDKILEKSTAVAQIWHYENMLLHDKIASLLAQPNCEDSAELKALLPEELQDVPVEELKSCFKRLEDQAEKQYGPIKREDLEAYVRLLRGIAVRKGYLDESQRDADIDELEDIAEQFTGEMREQLSVGEPWHMLSGEEGKQEIKIANAMHMEACKAHTDVVVKEVLELGRHIEIGEILDAHNSSIDAWIQANSDDLHFAGNLMEYLMKGEHIGPGSRPGGPIKDRLDVREKAEHQSKKLPEPLRGQIQSEHERYGIGFEQYVEAIGQVSEKENAILKRFGEGLLKLIDDAIEKLEDMIEKAEHWSWWLPKHTGIGKVNVGTGVLAVAKRMGCEWAKLDPEELRKIKAEVAKQKTEMQKEVQNLRKKKTIIKSILEEAGLYNEMLDTGHEGSLIEESVDMLRDLHEIETPEALSLVYTVKDARLEDFVGLRGAIHAAEAEGHQPTVEHLKKQCEEMVKFWGVPEDQIESYIEKYNTLSDGVISSRKNLEESVKTKKGGKEAREKYKEARGAMGMSPVAPEFDPFVSVMPTKKDVAKLKQRYKEAKEKIEALEAQPNANQAELQSAKAELMQVQREIIGAYSKIFRLHFEHIEAMDRGTRGMMMKLRGQFNHHAVKYAEYDYLKHLSAYITAGVITTIAEVATGATGGYLYARGYLPGNPIATRVRRGVNWGVSRPYVWGRDGGRAGVRRYQAWRAARNAPPPGLERTPAPVRSPGGASFEEDLARVIDEMEGPERIDRARKAMDADLEKIDGKNRFAGRDIDWELINEAHKIEPTGDIVTPGTKGAGMCSNGEWRMWEMKDLKAKYKILEEGDNFMRAEARYMVEKGYCGRSLEQLDDVDELIQRLREASRMDDAVARSGKLADIVSDPTLLREAAKHSDEAVRLQKATVLARRSSMAKIVGIGLLIDGIFIALNEARIKDLAKQGKMEEVRILKDKRESLILTGAGGVLLIASPTGWIAVPLVGGAVYADHLYEFAISMQKVSNGAYDKMRTGELISEIVEVAEPGVNWVDPALVGTGISEWQTKRTRAKTAFESYLFKTATPNHSPEKYKKAEDWFNGIHESAQKSHIKKYGSKEAAISRRYFDDLAFETKQWRRRKLEYFEYSTVKNKFSLEEHIRRTDTYEKLLQLNLVKGEKKYPDYWKNVDKQINEFHVKQLESARVRYASLKETQPEEAKQYAQQILKDRLKHTMLLADGLATAKLSPDGANIVRIELRRKFEEMYEPLMKQLEDGSKDIEGIEIFLAGKAKEISTKSMKEYLVDAKPSKFVSVKHEGKSYWVPVDKNGKFVNPNDPDFNWIKAVIQNPTYSAKRVTLIDDPGLALWDALKKGEKPDFRKSQKEADKMMAWGENFHNEKYGVKSSNDAVTSLFGII